MLHFEDDGAAQDIAQLAGRQMRQMARAAA